MEVRNVLIALAWSVSMAASAEAPERDAAIARLFADASDPAGPGCAVSVLQNGAPVFERAWGRANLEQPAPNTMNTVFEAGSVSKQFTAAAIAVLVDQGRIGLDDDIRRYLPELRDYGTPVTVRMLLTHTSGVRNWDDLVELAGRAREDASGYTQAEVLALIARQSELNFAPGSEYLYSNSNYVLLAIIAERVSGQSFADFSRTALFAPIGMSATQWRDDYTRVIPLRATAYTPDDSGTLHIDMPAENVIGPGGLLTTAGDLQRWNAYLANPPAEARGWVNLMTTTQGTLSDGTQILYGLGIEHEEVAGRPVLSHAGATAGYRAYLAAVPSEHLSAAILCNAGALNTEDIGPELVSLFLSASTAPATAAVTGQAPRGLAGNYRNGATGALVTLSVDDAGAHFNNGAAFVEASPDHLVNAVGTRTALIQRGARGVIERIALSRIGNSTVELFPVQAWAPNAADLDKFAGVYQSADVSAAWTIALDQDALRATGPRGETFLLDPIYRDAFAGRDAYWTLRFERNRRGAITGVRFTKTRTRGVLFEQPAR